MPSCRDVTVAAAAERVVRTERCTGCGACALLDPGLSMELVHGHMRPVRTDQASSNDVARFRRVCPGVVVKSPFARSAPHRHPVLGPWVAMWRAHATDPELRRRGSSGGVLSALAAWNADTTGGTGHAVAGCPVQPRRTVPVTITSKQEALAAASSRYAPVAAARDVREMRAADVVTGKPCEVAAMRAMNDSESPLMLSFFCAGSPSQDATDDLIRDLGGEPEALRRLWYRGDGWPGRFTAQMEDGAEVSTTYAQSWGRALGPSVSWRCRCCGDGMGESADLVAGDLWETDDRGYPSFAEQEGVSVLVARTQRGHAAALAAERDGAIHLEPVTVDEVLAAQPAQVARRKLLWGRLLPTLLMGLPVTRYKGFDHVVQALRRPRAVRDEVLGAAARLRRRGYDWAGGRIRPVLARLR